MSTSTDLAPVSGGGQLVTRDYLNERRELIREQLAPEATDAEMELFLEVCAARGLNPITRQIYAIHRKDKKSGKLKMSIQTGIDGFRLVAQRTGALRGQVGPEWCGTDGTWRDVWLDKAPPAAARVGVLRAGWDEPLYAVALWSEYAATYPDGNPSGQWAVRGAHMLAKCAAALALRSAFPEDLSGVYTDDEMAQVDAPRVTAGPPEDIDLGKRRYQDLIADHGEDAVKEAARAAGASSAKALADDTIYQRVEAALMPLDGEVVDTGEVISEDQRRRLEAIARELGRDHDWLSALAGEAGFDSTTKILRSQYDAFEQVMRDTAAGEDAA